MVHTGYGIKRTLTLNRLGNGTKIDHERRWTEKNKGGIEEVRSVRVSAH